MKLNISFECSRRTHWWNMVTIMSSTAAAPLAVFVATVFSGIHFIGDVDLYIVQTFVTLPLVWFLVSAGVGAIRIHEYQRVTGYITSHGARSRHNVLVVDPLYHRLWQTQGRRKVLAKALCTLPVPAPYEVTLGTYTSKGIPVYGVLSKEWWAATFSPAVMP